MSNYVIKKTWTCKVLVSRSPFLCSSEFCMQPALNRMNPPKCSGFPQKLTKRMQEPLLCFYFSDQTVEFSWVSLLSVTWSQTFNCFYKQVFFFQLWNVSRRLWSHSVRTKVTFNWQPEEKWVNKWACLGVFIRCRKPFNELNSEPARSDGSSTKRSFTSSSLAEGLCHSSEASIGVGRLPGTRRPFSVWLQKHANGLIITLFSTVVSVAATHHVTSSAHVAMFHFSFGLIFSQLLCQLLWKYARSTLNVSKKWIYESDKKR